jgi:hypothetical protein
MRGRALLNLSERVTGGKRLQRVLPFPWEAAARQDIHTAVLAIHASFARGIPLDQCIALATGTASPAEDDSTPEEVVEPIQATDWQGLVAHYRDHKISSGLIKQTTWIGPMPLACSGWWRPPKAKPSPPHRANCWSC